MQPVPPRLTRNAETEEIYFREGCYITEWSNSAADAELSIARARVEPGVRTRLHSLDGVTERYVILSGSGFVEVDGLEPSPVGPGDVVTIPPAAAQRITNTGAGDLVFLAVCTPRFTPRAYRDLEPA